MFAELPSGQNRPESLPVNVVDPLNRTVFRAWLRCIAGRCILDRSAESGAEPELFVSPGWIDLHAHVYLGVGSLGISADAVGIDTGVHVVADAGSAGHDTLLGLVKYVVPTFRTTVKAWLNISSTGLAYMPEVADIGFIDVGKTIDAALTYQPFVCGIKVRSEKSTVGSLGLQPLKLAAATARATGLPLMVHLGAPPPNVEEILDVLAPGDIITHCYHGKTCPPWLPSGEPIPALRRALERGVLMDVGHGVSSFSYAVAKKAIAAGFPPFSIGTDAHSLNVGGPVYDLPTVMTKLLACGLTLIDVVSAVTLAPATILRLTDWCDLGGELTHATVFEVTRSAPSGRRYVDTLGEVIVPENYIVPRAVVTEEGLSWAMC
jgi:dihydroorotase